MYDQFIKAKEEFVNKNYEKVLEILDATEFDESYHKWLIFIKSTCLSFLHRYEEALEVINEGIEKYPYEEYLWSQKVSCHSFNGDKEMAVKALDELERIVDKENKESLVSFAKKCDLVHLPEKSLKYSNMALDIDENFIDAIHQKAMAACFLKDNDLMSECADNLLKIEDNNDIVSNLLPFMLKLFSGDYRGSLKIINNCKDLDFGHYELLKGAIYNHMVDDLNIAIGTTELISLSIHESLDLLFNYHYQGIDNGVVNGTRYFIRSKD